MRSWFALAALLLAGCNFESAQVTETVDNTCGTDADCGDGACDGSICIDGSSSSVEVAIEVVGRTSEVQGAIPTSWAFPEERFSAPSALDLILPATREVRGFVRWDGLRVPATLRFVRRMSSAVEPIQPVPVEVDTLREVGGGLDQDAYDFSTVLVAGETYDVVVVPTSDIVTSPTAGSAPAIRSLPPLYFEVRIEDGTAGNPFRFDVSFPADIERDCTEDQKTNCTLSADIASVDGEVELAQPGLQVRAVDESNGRVVSSIGETDEFGRFAIRVGDETQDYLIRVTSSLGGALFPAVSIDPDVALANDTGGIRIPRIDAVQFTGRVRDETGSAVPGASVRFLSNSVFDDNQLGLRGTFSASTTTNQDGSFGTALLPGFYSMTVTPPDDSKSNWGVLWSEALVGTEAEAPESLIVPSKVAFEGSVRTFSGEPVAGVTVVARARMHGELVSMHRSKEVVSSPLGDFTMRLDLGVYDMVVKIPSETAYAWLLEPAVAMEDDLVRSYRLEPPIPVEGVVQASDGTVVPNALIRAYLLTTDGSYARSIQVAETVSDQDGKYRLVIAPRLGGE
jgi:hypothetical protein